MLSVFFVHLIKTLITMKKIKKSILLVLLVFSAFVNMAQEKYEFMTITYYITLSSKVTLISIDGKDFLKEEVALEKEAADKCNTNPLLLKVKEYQDKNWEVMSFNTVLAPTNTVGYLHIAYLRRKK